jgi:rubrerythrin
MEEKHDYTDHKVILSSAYAWIPTIFTVSEDGQNVFIDGYINGLGRREQYPTLFQLLESTFKVAMPMLEHSAKFVFSHESADERPSKTLSIVNGVRTQFAHAITGDRFEQRKDYNEEEDANLEGYNKILEEQNREKEVYRRHEEIAIEQKRHAMRAEKQAYVAGEHDQVPDVSSIWAGKNLKVIVKVCLCANCHSVVLRLTSSRPPTTFCSQVRTTPAAGILKACHMSASLPRPSTTTNATLPSLTPDCIFAGSVTTLKTGQGTVQLIDPLVFFLYRKYPLLMVTRTGFQLLF